ncbi:MAG TPA: flagellar protein FlaG [Bryobacteraceae bacterium]|nr:flagellar protein FlaG [Bryobacteraceae bacterium]
MEIDSIRAAQMHGAMAQVSAAPAERRIERAELILAIGAVNESALFGDEYELTFSLDRGTRRPLLQLVNRETREVIRQIPPEYVLRAARELSKRR